MRTKVPGRRALRATVITLGAAAGITLGGLVVGAQNSAPHEWITWGGDIERTGWNRAETKLTKANVGQLKLKWQTQVDQEIPIAIESGNSMLTAPLVARGVATPQGTKKLVYTQGSTNIVVAVDTETGDIVWRHAFTNSVDPARPANWVCTNTSTATPVIDRAAGTLYALADDGRLHGLDIATGQAKMDPVPFTPPYARSWSLNLINGVIYTTVGRGCGNPTPESQPARGRGAAAPAPARQGGPPAAQGGRGGRGGRGGASVASHMIAMDLNDPARPISRFFTSQARPSGAWSRAGLTWAHDSLLVLTADGAWEPDNGLWGETLLRLAPKTLELMDYFTPANLEELNTLDLDYASGGIIGFTLGDRKLVLSSGKDGMVYLHDALKLGGDDHRTPLQSLKAGNDHLAYTAAGTWGSPITMVNDRNERWIYLAMQGPPSTTTTFERTHGDATDGSIMAFQVVMRDGQPQMVPKWVSRNLSMPDAPVIANGMVFALSTGENTIQRHTDPRYHAIYQRPGEPPLSRSGTLTPEERAQNTSNTILYAFDAETGEELYSSQQTIDDWTHLTSITVADGQVYVVTRKSILHAFGLD